MKSAIAKYPFFLYLLSVFFVLHGAIENFDFIPFMDALLLTGTYFLASFIIVMLSWLLFKNLIKASLFAFILMSINFFFGSTHDLLKAFIPGSFLVKYAFILPAIFLFLIAIFILIKKREKGLVNISYFLNILFLLLILVDTGILAVKTQYNKNNSASIPIGFIDCDTCSKPDIFFIVADEYAGKTELADQFSFDNSDFINKLSERGFYTIPNSHSNYNYTPFAVGSFLNMDYLDLENADRGKNDLTYSYEIIRDNRLLQFLDGIGYKFYNFSIFDFEGQPSKINRGMLPVKTKLITAQTLLSRLNRDIRYNLITKFKSNRELKLRTYANKKNNELLYNLTQSIAKTKSSAPKFIYTHLEMPHYPYYYDKDGNEQPFENLLEGFQVNKKEYIGYLQYSNKKLLELIDDILKNNSSPPVIILLGDHGFRHFNEKVELKYYFLNQVSVLTPSKTYDGFIDSLNGVNLFRVLLNSNFGQQLPYLLDSTIYLKD